MQRIQKGLFHTLCLVLWMAVIGVGGVLEIRAENIFSNVAISGLPAAPECSLMWWDEDNDGRLDFLFKGFAFNQFDGELWRNTESGFTSIQGAAAPNTRAGFAAWGDYDNDGRLDVLLLATTNIGYSSQLWRNTGTGFANVLIPDLPQVSFGSAAWGDYDNDGRLDFLLTGIATNTPIAQLWRNTGEGFTNVPIPGLPGMAEGAIAWADYDNDGWLDFLIIGYPASQLWRNTGTGFTNVPVPGLPGTSRGRPAWGDYDGDGKLDFILIAGDGGSFISQLWRNTGDGFTPVSVPGLPGLQQGSIAWGDYDNDGRLDFLVTGFGYNGSSYGGIAQLWRNTGSGFTNVPETSLTGVYMGAGAWADYNNDGRLDILLAGATDIRGFFGITKLLKNVGPIESNAPPGAPTGLTASVVDGLATVSWNAATDDHTPTSTLTYNLRVGTAPDAGDVVAPQAAASGFRRLVAMGNCQLRTNALLRLAPGRYYWSVQAVDGAFAGSAFAESQTFTIPAIATAPLLVNAFINTEDYFEFQFTNTPGAIFTALSTTNLAVPAGDWTTLGAVPEISPGHFRFTAPHATNDQAQFYRVRSP